MDIGQNSQDASYREAELMEKIRALPPGKRA